MLNNTRAHLDDVEPPAITDRNDALLSTKAAGTVATSNRFNILL